jgi:hypothetical protein
MKFIVKDNREVVELAAINGKLTTTGKFKPSRRVLSLTDAQVELYADAIMAALEDGTLVEDRRAAE